MTKISLSDIEKLKAAGKIRGYNLPEKKTGKKVVVPRVKAKQVAAMECLLAIYANLHGYQFETEKRFHPERKWRFDMALPEMMIAIEYEGIFGKGKSGHTTKQGYMKDTDKYNAAAELGWQVFRFTAHNYKGFLVIIDNYINSKP